MSDLDIIALAYEQGRLAAATRFASSDLRRACSLATVSQAWRTYRRDAGAGEVGPAHQDGHDAACLLIAHDQRRDPMLIWLADHGAAEIADAAGIIARMANSRPRYDQTDMTTLEMAIDAVQREPASPGPVERTLAHCMRTHSPVVDLLGVVAVAVDRLRCNPAFIEGAGDNVHFEGPRGGLDHYVTAEPAATWALNLALIAKGTPLAQIAPCPGLISRALFRADLEPEEIAHVLVDGMARAVAAAFATVERLAAELARGRDALSHLSRNARAREAWLLVAALTSMTRGQLGRALGLSRAGADIQARTLAAAGLVTLPPGGRIDWLGEQRKDASSAALDHGPLESSVQALDASMAEIDRLLARTSFHARP